MNLSHLRAGIIGTGFIGPVHLEALKRLGVQVNALCGSRDSALALAKKWGVPEVYGSYDYEAMYASPNIDVVHITSPNKAHVEQSLAALAAGKHVVCEKPLGMNTADTARVVKAAAKSDRVFAVNYNCRFFPAVLQMRKMIERGDLGKIIHVQGHFFQDWLLKETDYNWRLLASEGGKLRAVGDIGTHWMDAVSFVLGAKPDAVFAMLETFHKTRKRPRGEVKTFAKVNPKDMVSYKVDTEDFASVLLQFGKSAHGNADGVHANASISQVAAGWKCSLAIGIYGTRGQRALGIAGPERPPHRPSRHAERNPAALRSRFRQGHRAFHRLPRRPRRGFPRLAQDALPLRSTSTSPAAASPPPSSPPRRTATRK